MSWLKFVGLFLGIAAIPVVGLARAAAGETWAAPLPLVKALLMVLVVAGAFLLIVVPLGMVWPKYRAQSASVIGWFAVAVLNSGRLDEAFESAGWTTTTRHWVLVVLVMAVLATWIGTRFDPQVRFLITFVPILLVFEATLLGVDLAQMHEPDPAAAAPSDAEIGAPPSIWFIVLDAHASPQALRDLYDVDLSRSTSRLEASGFRVWDDARSNYTQTLASIPSLLSGEVWEAGTLDDAYAAMLAGVHGDTSLVAAIGKAGYTVRMLPANWTRSDCGETVDECLGNPRYDEQWRALLQSTPLTQLLPRVFSHPWPTGGVRTLNAIAETPSDDHHFTFVHSLASHPPIILDDDCRHARDGERHVGSQLVCVHNTLFTAIQSIDLTSEIVIVTADHGFSIGDVTAPPEEWSDALARGRFSAFVAISTPDDCEHGFPENLSGAQILPLVLNCYGAELPVPSHKFIVVYQRRLEGISAAEMAWDGWSMYRP